MSRVSITGIGVVAPGAVGVDAFRAQLAEGRSGIAEVDRFDTTGLHAHTAAVIRDFKARDFIAPMKLRRMNVPSRYALAATRLALNDAGVEASQLGDTGVALGTAFGPVQTSVEYMQEYVEKGAALAPPQLFAESVANAPGSHIAIEHGFRGFNVTVTQRESSALAAAMYAASQLIKGTVQSAIVGGVEELNEMSFSVLDRLGALAHANGNGHDELARPFDVRRNGLVIGEGSAVFIAQSAAIAGAYGYFSGFGIGRDTTATISDWGHDAEAVARTMRAAIDDAELTPADIDAVYASANSTRRADTLEYRALQALFGERVPPVVATKGYFGEYAAGGGLHLASAFLAMREQTLHASFGFESGDAEMRLDVTRERRPAELRHILVNSISAGGGIVCAIVSREAA
ncbi:MAG TPA: beta-ketoacyl synthase N-terminal-like domain-containing protein [Thermoanaerobaculia bacterium]|nr:beta-ketoacyl synthase N-terminal-like domain-containing protein [Thermoanaerobaculia bacterium]